MILAMLPMVPKMELVTQREFVFTLIIILEMLKLLIISAKNVQAAAASILDLALLDLVFVASVSTFKSKLKCQNCSVTTKYRLA